MAELTTTAENKALAAANYKAFGGIDLRQIKDRVAEMATQIGKHGLFEEYTRHDISHINKLILSLDWLIPKETANRMKPGDWLMLVLSIYFHDLGMVVTKDEYEERYNSGFAVYKQWLIDNQNTEFLDKVNKLEEPDKFLYQEFIRANHASRIKQWLIGKNDISLGKADIMAQEVKKIFINLDEEFRIDLGIICESHHADDLDNFLKYEVEKPYGSSTDEHVNLHYCAIILRTADLLHITSDRTPSIEYRLINPSDPISQDEWAKQMAVKSVRPKKMRDGEGDVDYSIQSNTIEITAIFKGAIGANGFFGLSSYIQYARNEVKKNYDWTQKANKTEGSTYFFPWLKIDDSKLQTEGFEPKLFEFNLDQNKILNLLVGHTLYNDTTVVVREVVQNSIDAIKLQQYIFSKKLNRHLEGRIFLSWNSESKVLSFSDNGTGMTQELIEEHLLKVGSSRYQSETFKREFPGFSPISRFGIGILTCFLVADNVEIITNHIDEQLAKKLTIRNVNGKYLLQHLEKTELPEIIKEHGTQINLQVRSDIDLTDLLDQVNRWVVFPPCNVFLQIDQEAKIKIGFASPKEAIERYLKEENYNVDGISIKVESDILDGIEIAYALKFDSFFKEWTIMRHNHVDEEGSNYLGTCIEGIRVKFESPGYSGTSIVSIANASGQSAPTTNVARSNIELSAGSKDYLSTVYSLYIRHLKKELESLQSQHEFSISWAAEEVKYLLAPLAFVRPGQTSSNLEDSELFFKELDTAELLLVEVDSQRSLKSVRSLSQIEDVWVVDSKLFQSIEALLRETKGSPSLLNLVKTINQGASDNTEHLKCLLCGYSATDNVQERVLMHRNVGEVRIYPVDRRVDVCWSTTRNNWLGFLRIPNLEDSYRDSTALVE